MSGRRARGVGLAALLVALAGCTSAQGGSRAAPTTTTTAAVPGALTGCPEQTGAEARGTQVLPALAFDCPGGGSLDLARAPGVPTVLNLWGSWCLPCRDELPVIQEFADAAGGQVRVMGLISRDGRPQAESFAADAGISFPNAFDGEGELMAAQGLNGLPFTYFIDADGGLTYTQVGPVESVDELRGLVAQHLGVQL